MLDVGFRVQDTFPVKTKGYFQIILRVVINIEEDILTVIRVFEEFLF